MSVSRECNWIITLTSGFFQIKIENICLFKLIKKHGNVFKKWLCPNFLLLPKKSELPKIWGGCSPPRPPGPYAYGSRGPSEFALIEMAWEDAIQGHCRHGNVYRSVREKQGNVVYRQSVLQTVTSLRTVLFD